MQPIESTTDGTFDVSFGAPRSVLGRASQMDFDKTFHGGLDATSVGTLLSAGDPAAGSAGYVAMEVVTGRLDGRDGTFAFQQSGRMADGEQSLRYEVVPGSGTGGLTGLRGTLELRVEDGAHRYTLAYRLPAGTVAGS